MPSKKQKLFNGKPMSHWQRKADELVIANLHRAAHSLDNRSIVGKLAQQRLLQILEAENPALVAKLKNDIARVNRNMNLVLFSILATDEEYETLTKSLRKRKR